MDYRTQPLRLDLALVDQQGVPLRRFGFFLEGVQQLSGDVSDLQVRLAMEPDPTRDVAAQLGPLKTVEAMRPEPPALAETLARKVLAAQTEPHGYDDTDVRRMLMFAGAMEPASHRCVITGTHAERAGYPAASYPECWYYETDRKLVYLSVAVAGVYGWHYITGTMAVTLSPNTKPTDLTTLDTGALIWATDYYHLYQWDGSNWAWGPAEAGSGHVSFGVLPHPGASCWGLCNGGTYTFATSNGSLGNLLTPNWCGDGDAFFFGTSTPTTRAVPKRATWESAAKTDSGGSHTHDITVTVDAQIGMNGATSGTDFSAAPSGHTHTASGSASTTGSHQHVLSDANAQLKLFDETNGGLPARVGVAIYMRL